jgi:RNase adaptor protein for sRNA GlmZ degradation
MPTVHITSYGTVHALPPTGAHIRLDVAAHFRDPHINPAMRQLTGQDPLVVDTVLATPGIPEVVDGAVLLALGYLAGPAPQDVRIAVGCVGGRHRSVVVAGAIARQLADDYGADVHLEHRDLHRPVRRRTEG